MTFKGEQEQTPSIDQTHHTVEMPQMPYITEAFLDKLQENFPKLQRVDTNDKVVRLITKKLPRQAEQDLMLDLQFYFRNPDLPLENLCSRLNNFKPKNESQQELLRYAKALVDLKDPKTAAGLFIYGDAGVGKHMLLLELPKNL